MASKRRFNILIVYYLLREITWTNCLLESVIRTEFILASNNVPIPDENGRGF